MLFLRGNELQIGKQTKKKQLKVNVGDVTYANMRWSQNCTDTQRAWLPEKNG